jgi:DNA-binding NarL/FixJ family response regulator
MMESPAHTLQRVHETSTISIVLVDEQLVVTEGMRRLFEAEPDFRVVGSACDPHHAAKLIEEYRPDVVIASLKGRALARLVNRLRYHPGARASHDARLVVLTAANENSHVVRTAHHGLAGALLCKDTSPQELFENVRNLVAGADGIRAEPWATPGATVHGTAAADTPPFNLTPRELQIVTSVCRGDTNSTIAGQLGIRPATVKQHLAQIFDKLGVSHRTELALDALSSTSSPDVEVGAPPVTSKYRFH